MRWVNQNARERIVKVRGRRGSASASTSIEPTTSGYALVVESLMCICLICRGCWQMQSVCDCRAMGASRCWLRIARLEALQSFISSTARQTGDRCSGAVETVCQA